MDARAALLLALLIAGCSCSEEPAAPEVAAPKTEVVVPPGERRVIELADGVRVEILVEGQGALVGAGTTVLLDYELGYVPSAPPAAEPPPESAEPAAEPADPAKDGASSSESGKTESANPKATEVAAAEPAAAEPAATEPAITPTPESPVTAVEPAADETVDPVPESIVVIPQDPVEPAADATPAPAEGAPATDATPPATEIAPVDEPPAMEEPGTAPPPDPASAPLERVVIASSKQGVGPVSVRVGADGPLLPALSRALVGLREGTRATIRIPAAAGYSEAARTAAGIPADVALEADVRIRKVRP